jgi:hypothetical protein
VKADAGFEEAMASIEAPASAVIAKVRSIDSLLSPVARGKLFRKNPALVRRPERTRAASIAVAMFRHDGQKVPIEKALGLSGKERAAETCQNRRP